VAAAAGALAAGRIGGRGGEEAGTRPMGLDHKNFLDPAIFIDLRFGLAHQLSKVQHVRAGTNRSERTGNPSLPCSAPSSCPCIAVDGHARRNFIAGEPPPAASPSPRPPPYYSPTPTPPSHPGPTPNLLGCCRRRAAFAAVDSDRLCPLLDARSWLRRLCWL
jgi:hypothetical protein